MTQLPSCGVCGTAARPPFRAPPAEMAPDLDGRPGEPTRSTLPQWIATCRRCGTSAPDLSKLPEGAGDAVRSTAYQALRQPGPAMPFLRWACICEALGRQAEAAEATLQAAWALDDMAGAGPPPGQAATAANPAPIGTPEPDPAAADAAALRRRALALWGPPHGAEDALRQLDLLRRAGDFRAALACADALDGAAGDENTAAILAFQRDRIAAGDTGRHMISSALRPPARRPHVTHGTAALAPGGFWRRLLGG